jgi:GntR family transcriptional regulator, rspAB operon transcriptional repressor
MMKEKSSKADILNEITQLPDQIAQYLAEKIIHLEIRPGEHIFEAKIAEELGVSRSPVREALHILNKQFLVEFMPRRGAVVAGFDVKFIEDLYDVLAVHYVLLAKTGLPKATEEQFDQVYTVIKLLEECADKSDFEGYYDGMFQFASVCIKIVNNKLLEKIVLNLWPSKRRMEYATLFRRKGNLKENLSFFLQGINYFSEGKFDMIEKTIYDYIEKEKKCAILLVQEFEKTNIN